MAPDAEAKRNEKELRRDAASRLNFAIKKFFSDSLRAVFHVLYP
jgi:hypothetical protein